jgi:hypothetical protein
MHFGVHYDFSFIRLRAEGATAGFFEIDCDSAGRESPLSILVVLFTPPRSLNHPAGNAATSRLNCSECAVNHPGEQGTPGDLRLTFLRPAYKLLKRDGLNLRFSRPAMP